MTSRRERERRGRREGFFALKTGIFYCFLYSRRKQNKSRWALCIFFFPVQKTGKLWHCSSKLWLLWCLRNLCKKLNCSFPIPSSGLRLSRRRALFLLLLQAGVAHLILIRGRNVECVILPCVLLCFCHCSLHQSIYSTQSHHPWSSGLTWMLVLMDRGIWPFLWVIKYHVRVQFKHLCGFV